MTPDLLLSLGLVFLFLAIPSAVAAYSERRAPRVSAVLIVIAGAMILFAALNKPGGYRLQELPEVLIGAFAQVLRQL